MKKFISLLLCVMLIFSLSACKKSNPEPLSEELPNKPQNTEIVKPEEPKSFNVKFSFTGDMILAQYRGCPHPDAFNYYANSKPATYFLDKVRTYFEQDDFTIVNLENVLSDRELTPVSKNYSPAFWFKSKASTIDILSCSSIEAVTVNNNHTRDYGQEGYNDTIATIENAGIEYGGEGKIIYFEKNKFKIAIICVGLWGSYSVTPALSKLEEAKSSSDYQIIFFHGGTEKLHAPEQWKQNAARTLVDNGADLVVGSHPHVLQPREVYNGVEIVYSLGNFCYGGARKPENRTIIYQTEITVSKDNQVENFTSNIIPCYVYTGSANNFQPAPVEEGPIKQKILDFMDWKCSSPV